jgi:cytochrome d ubiquinol oxidase subunit II
MFRGVALELRSHFPSDIWHQFWDASFAISSVMLILLFGVALGNIVRGLPLDAQGYFAGTFGYLLNPYALLVGVFAVLALMLHGATFLIMRTQGPAAVRARALLPRLWGAVLALYLVVSAYTVAERGVTFSWIDVIPLLSLIALGAVLASSRRENDRRAFTASCLWLASLLFQAAATLYPYLLAGPGGKGGLSIFDAAPSPTALASALGVTLAGLLAVGIYGTLVLGRMAGKLSVGE